MKPTMLVVDDMEINRALLVNAFQDKYEVLQAENGIAALALMRKYKERLTIVILDIVMPEMSGMEVLKEISRDEDLKKIPVVIVTADKEKGNEFNALELGAVDVLNKPYDIPVIRKRISNIVNKREVEIVKEQNLILRLKREEDERYRIMQEQTNTILIELDAAYRVKYLSDSIISQIPGDYSKDDNLFESWCKNGIVSSKDQKLFREFIADFPKIDSSRTRRFTLRLLTLNKRWEWYRMVATVIEGENEEKRIIITLNNVDEEMRTQEKIRYQAKYDILTGLYNKNTFFRKTQKLITDNQGDEYTLIRLDIERFKVINDLFGMSEGNRLLQYVAELVQRVCKEGCTFGRLEADNFVICMPFHDKKDILDTVEAIGEGARNYDLNFEVTINIGIYSITDKTTSVDLMCDRAKMALNTIKGNYMKSYAVYDEILRETMLREQVIVNEMDAALEKGQFSIYMQPKYDLNTEQLIGAESLVRWLHPTKGMISPGIFIEIFEKNGFITKLDHYVWERTCMFLKECREKGIEQKPVSVNISRMNLYNPELANELEGLVEKYDLDPELLELEITESAYMENPMYLLTAMEQLQNKGFVILMDDFGSGYSSLNMLRNVPVDILKVDMNFLQGEDKYGRGRSILKSIVNMSKDIDVPTLIEGVETKDQVEFLREIGCSQVQGYYYARPMPLDEYKALLIKADVCNEE